MAEGLQNNRQGGMKKLSAKLAKFWTAGILVIG